MADDAGGRTPPTGSPGGGPRRLPKASSSAQPAGAGRSSSARRRRRRSGGGGGGQGAGRAGGRAEGPRPNSARRPQAGRATAPGPSRLIRETATDVEEPLAATAARAGIAVPADPVTDGLSRLVSANRRRAARIVTAPAIPLLAICAGVGAALGAALIGVVVGALCGVAVGTGLWRGGARLVLRALRARPVDEEDVPGPASQAEGLCATMGLPVPALHLVEDSLPGALSVGRGPRDGALVLTTGLVDALDPVAVEAVLAHELAHVKRHDNAPATVAAALALVSGVGPGAGGRAVHWLAGRGREFDADRHAVSVTRYPPALSKALATMAAATSSPVAVQGTLARSRAGQLTRWLFTVALPDRSGRVPDSEPTVGELDAPSVRVAALDEW